MGAEQKLVVNHKRPSRSNRVLWVLGEIGVEAREVEIDLFKGEQRNPTISQSIHRASFRPSPSASGRCSNRPPS